MNGSFQMPPGMDMQAMFNTFMQTMMQQQNQQERGGEFFFDFLD